MVEEQLKFELTELINRWTLRDFESQEIWPVITKTEFLEALQEVMKVTLGISSIFTPITTPQNITMCLDPHTPAQIVDCSYDLPNNYKSLDTLPISPCEYSCEDVCRSEAKMNTTKIFDDSPPIKMEKQLDTTTTFTKTVPSPVMYINEIGRSGTFEIQNKNSTMDLIDLKMNRTEVIDEVSFKGKEIEDLTKKLEKAQSEISGIANAAVNIAAEINRINKHLQKEANRFGVPRKRTSKSPMVTVTPIMSRNNIPKLSDSMRRKSSSFTTIVHEDKNKLFSPSPSRAKSTNSLSTRKKSPISCAVSCDQGTKNLKFAHIRSTIPKPSPSRKKISKEA